MTLVAQGKVRDIFEAGDDRLLLVATDRISAFDVVLPTPIPHKGRVLTACSLYLVRPDERPRAEPRAVAPTVPGSPRRSTPTRSWPVARRSCAAADVVPMECVVRGYLTGSGWSQYKREGLVCGIALPEGLIESQQLPEPIFTPTTKAAEGHDMPLTPDEARELVGDGLYERLKELSIGIYRADRDRAPRRTA